MHFIAKLALITFQILKHTEFNNRLMGKTSQGNVSSVHIQSTSSIFFI